MADLTPIMQAISTLGFPIVCTVMVFWVHTKEAEKHREEIKQLNEMHHQELITMQEHHKEEMLSATTVIANNTLAIQKLTDALTLGGVTNGKSMLN